MADFPLSLTRKVSEITLDPPHSITKFIVLVIVVFRTHRSMQGLIYDVFLLFEFRNDAPFHIPYR